MFMDVAIKNSRERYGRKIVSTIRICIKSTPCLLGAALLFSSCVSEQSSLDLNTSLTQANSGATYNNFQGNRVSNEEFVSPVAPGSPIPIKAPRRVVQTSSAQTPATPNQTAQVVPANQVATAAQVSNPAVQQVTEDGQAPTLVTALAEGTQTQDDTTKQLANVTSQQIVANSTGSSTSQTQPEGSQVAALAPSLEQEAPNNNFSKRWANGTSSKKKNNYLRHRRNDNTGTIISSRKKIKKLQASSRRANSTTISSNEAVKKTYNRNKSRRSTQEMTALPGVKSNNEIFGIEEHEQVAETKVAALSGLGRISPNGLRVQHSKVQVACLKQGVLQILKKVERRYGKKPIITSGYRDPKRNRRAGGARNSQHIYCKAVDIQVEGVSKWNLAKYLRSIPGRGGVGTYCRTKSVHIDIGSKRDWHSKCRRSSVKKRKKKKKS